MQHIKNDCDQNIKIIKEKAEQNRLIILDIGKARAQKAQKEILALAETKAKQIAKQASSRARLEARNTVLKCKRKEIDKTVDMIIDYLCDLDDKSYFDIIYSLIHKLSAESGIIYFNRTDTKRLPKDIGKKLLSIGIDAKIGDAPVQIRGGFIFKNSNIEDNMSFEALLSEKKDEVEDLINRCLFKNQGG